MKMSAWWMFMILLGWRSTHAMQAQSTCACNAQPKHTCVPLGGKVDVPCPALQGELVKFILLQDEEMIYNHTCSSQGINAMNCTAPYSRAGVELRGNRDNKSVTFVLTGVNASSYGIYRCEATVMFPPPFVSPVSGVNILVLVQGHHCGGSCRNANVKTGDKQYCGFHWIWIIGLISIYSVTVTIFAIVNYVKLRRSDSQSDYINTKPGAPRERRKKRGIQISIPRHF